MNKKTKSAILIFFILALFIIASVANKKYLAVGDLPSNVKLAIPVFASFKCDVVGTGSPIYNIGSSGVWISKQDIGVVTNQVSNIHVTITKSFWDYLTSNILGGGVRIKYLICDSNKNNCQERYKNLVTFGTYSLDELPFTSMQIDMNSIYVVAQTKASILSSWVNKDLGGTISYSYNKFGLRLYSTSKDPAGTKICDSSCDLSCPTQSYREKLILNTKDSLRPSETAPYLEYWNTINFDINSQYGATIYDSSNNKFCLAGAVYTAKELNMDNGITYIYPDSATRQIKSCCPGAVISTSTEDKICKSDYTWQTITKDTKLRCQSDINCPNAGQFTCQNKIKSGWSCSGTDSIGRYCKQDTGTQVSCCSQYDCATDQTCQNNKCVGGYVNSPLNLTRCLADRDCGSGNYCDSGSCKVRTTNQSQCAWYDLPCKISLFLTTLNTILNIIKAIALAILVLMSVFVSKNFIESKILTNKKDRFIVVILSLLIAVGVFFALYALFFTSLFWLVSVSILGIFIITKVIKVGI